MKNTNSIILLLIIFTTFSCNENLNLNERDVVKYDYLKPFLSKEKNDFKGNHNIDSENFEFSYIVDNTKNTLSEIDEKATKEGWNKRNIDSNTISYTKQIQIFESELSLVVVNVKFSKNNDRINFEVK
ncbi:MAG: hypothetical protein E2604_13985 [Flavobacterium sp.]|nr:hypothetical protein [Flavobacterium sp.]